MIIWSNNDSTTKVYNHLGGCSKLSAAHTRYGLQYTKSSADCRWGLTTTNVTALKQSPVNEQGANSASLSVSDQLGSALSVGIGGALVNVIGHAPQQIATGFLVIAGLMAAIALSGTLLAGRTR